MVIALAYLLCVAVSLVSLAITLRPRPTTAPAPTTPQTPPTATAQFPADAHAEVRLILAAATQLAARLDTAA